MLQSIKNIVHTLIAWFWVVWFGFPGRKLIVIGVTGTDGKTTTTSMIYHILKQAGYAVSMITSVQANIAGKSYDTGFHVTTPHAYFIQKFLAEAVKHGDTHMVLEVTSHALSQNRVVGVPFFIAALTNITHEHLDYHKSFAVYKKTKFKLLKQARVITLNADDAQIYNSAISCFKGKKIISYGIKRIGNLSLPQMPLRLILPGEFNMYNALAARAVCTELGVSEKIIRSSLGNFTGVKGRMEVIATKPFRVIVDFAHTANALEQALKTVKITTTRNLIHVFGAAGQRDRLKRPLMGKTSAKYADIIILTEEDYRSENIEDINNEIAHGIPKDMRVLRIADRSQAILEALSMARSGDTVILTGKGHEKSLCRGTIEYPWSDQDEVKKILSHLKDTNKHTQ